MILMINDRFYNEQEIRQLIKSQADELTKAKQLLKAAVEDIYQEKCDTCTQEIDCKFCCCEGLYKWQHEAEALALIREDGDTNG